MASRLKTNVAMVYRGGPLNGCRVIVPAAHARLALARRRKYGDRFWSPGISGPKEWAIYRLKNTARGPVFLFEQWSDDGPGLFDT